MPGPLLLPVRDYRLLASFDDHLERSPKSTEPGVDLRVPIGTEVYAPDDGVIWGYSHGIVDATGRWVGIDFDNGMSCRMLHNSKLLRTGGRVHRGELVALSGASGYGYTDWRVNDPWTAEHVHWTVWPTHTHRYGYRAQNQPYSIDPMTQIGGSQLSGGVATTIQRKDTAPMALDMSVIRDKESNQVFGFFSNGRIKHLPEQSGAGDQAMVAAFMAGQRNPEGTYFIHGFDRNDFQTAIWTTTGGRRSLGEVLALANGNAGLELPPLY